MRGLWFWGCGRGRGKVRVEEWGGDVILWVSDFGGVSDKEREMERWRPTVARIFFFLITVFLIFLITKKKKGAKTRSF